jgi:hypothetical protein
MFLCVRLCAKLLLFSTLQETHIKQLQKQLSQFKKGIRTQLNTIQVPVQVFYLIFVYNLDSVYSKCVYSKQYALIAFLVCSLIFSLKHHNIIFR